MSKPSEEMKRIMTEMVGGLKKAGVDVQNAAIFEFGNQEGKTPTPKLDDTIGKVFNNMVKNGFPFKPIAPVAQEQDPGQTTQPQAQEEECYCPNCFNFESFEKVLSKKLGVFDYLEMELGGKKFRLKAFIGNDGLNHFMIDPAPEPQVDTTDWTPEALQAALSNAVANKNYADAQYFMNQLAQTKKP